MNVLAKFENDQRKIMDMRVLMELLCPAASLSAHPPAKTVTIPLSSEGLWGNYLFKVTAISRRGQWVKLHDTDVIYVCLVYKILLIWSKQQIWLKNDCPVTDSWTYGHLDGGTEQHTVTNKRTVRLIPVYLDNLIAGRYDNTPIKAWYWCINSGGQLHLIPITSWRKTMKVLHTSHLVRPSCGALSNSALQWYTDVMGMRTMWAPGLGSIPFFQFNSNSNSVIFNSNSNSNSITHNKFQFQFQFQFRRFQFQFQFQFRRFQIPAISILVMTGLCLPSNWL